ncbi:MAG TPA: alpha/beta fold hydrolase [Ktedonobacteraceae bacterium]|nr:alpha/beta fold hydrolase [Ktedonobacteraceae bacterium]
MQSGRNANLWVFNVRQHEGARLRLFCFPSAGGGASMYVPWINAFAPDVEVYPVQLPGRENRMKEPPCSQFDGLIEELCEALLPYFTAPNPVGTRFSASSSDLSPTPASSTPFAFFGHSMGALISFGLTHQLLKRGDPLPAHLLLSAYRAPQIPNPESLHTLADEPLVRKMIELNGTQRGVLEDPEMRRLILPLMRADFSICETYHHTASEPLAIPITAFGGLEDTRAGRDVLAAWREQTSKQFRLHLLPGGHFYFRTTPQPLWQLVKQELQPLLER